MYVLFGEVGTGYPEALKRTGRVVTRWRKRARRNLGIGDAHRHYEYQNNVMNPATCAAEIP